MTETKNRDQQILNMRVLKGDSFMIKFTCDVAERAGFTAYEIICEPDDLPPILNRLSEMGAKIMIGAVSEHGNRWNTKMMAERGLVIDFAPNPDQEEAQTASCVPVSLRALGFAITDQMVSEYSTNFSSNKTPSTGFLTHVMAIKKVGNKWRLTDQHGTGVTNNKTLIEMAKFRKLKDPTLNLGYFFCKTS